MAKGVTVGTKKQHFTFAFTSPLASTDKGQVSFNIGGQGDGFSVVLDNVSLKEGKASTKPTPKPTGEITLPVEPPGSIAPGEPAPSKPDPTPTPGKPEPTPAPGKPVPGEGPFAQTSGLYVDPESNPAAWVAENKGNPDAEKIQSNIADKPIARWFGEWSGDIQTATSAYVAAAGDKLPVLVAYNIPGRDCKGHSAGGAGSPDAYKKWIDGFAAGIGDKPALVIIEPDALAQLDCFNAEEKKARTELLSYAVDQLAAKAPNAWTYMDGGNAEWIAPGEMAKRLQSVGVDKIRGFTVNVSNYFTTEESTKYANAVNDGLGNKSHYVIDSSRNGKGANGEWCNPGGRQLGEDPQAGGAGDALLWIKVPGDSDGACGIAPGAPAGQFDPKLATALIAG
ncbi:MAG: endoglucanase [Corynebacteriales bacterium]|nr:endoglucanase [Mycobacteriales bacterium]